MSIIKYVPGTKAEGDKIALIKGHAISYEEIAELVIHAMNTEDLIYPPSEGLMGALYFKMYLTDAMEKREIPDRAKYKFPTEKCCHGV